MNKKVKGLFLFANGNLAVVDEQGQQIAELQQNVISYLWATFATSKGYNVDGAILETELGNMKIEKAPTGGWRMVGL